MSAKITDLTALTTLATGDFFCVVDISDTSQAATGTTKKITMANVTSTLTGIPISTALSGAGTGVLTALAINVGSAGAFIVLGGAVGTPTSITLTNGTALPIGGIAGLGTGVAAALAAALNGTTGLLQFNGAYGTPTSITLTNATSLPLSSVTGFGANVGTMLATFNSANIAAACTDETGFSSGALLVFNNAPTLAGIVTTSGSATRTVNAMGALAIDVTKGVNTKTISTGQTFTFSGTPATAETWFSIKITNSSGAAVTATIPSSFSVGQNTTITTVSVPASGIVFLTWEYDGSAYNLYGDPPTTSGSGSFVLTTSPTIGTANLTGANLLAEGGSIQLDPAGSADGAYSGITMTGTSGYAQAFGDLVMLDPNQSPARWELASVSAAAGAVGDCRGGLAVVVVTATDGNTCTLLRFGVVRADANFPTFTVNGAVYATTTGDVTNTQPSTTDHVIRIVGNALTTDEMFFDPDKNWITHT